MIEFFSEDKDSVDFLVFSLVVAFYGIRFLCSSNALTKWKLDFIILQFYKHLLYVREYYIKWAYEAYLIRQER